eukprot:s553_g2.t1
MDTFQTATGTSSPFGPSLLQLIALGRFSFSSLMSRAASQPVLAPNFAGTTFGIGLVSGPFAGGFLGGVAFAVAFAFGGGPFGSTGLADPGTIALGPTGKEASLLTGAFGGGAFGVGRALALCLAG